MTIQKSILRYPGGKSKAVDVILPYFPSDLDTMVAPFFGGGSIELACVSNGVRVWGYDIYKQLVVFWQQLLSNQEKLHERVCQFEMPLPKDKFYEMQKNFETLTDELEIAAQFYVINRTSFSGTTLSGGMSSTQQNWTQSCLDRLRDFSLDGMFSSSDLLTVSHMDFKQSLLIHNEDFAYLDPPYLLEKSSLYGVKGNTHKNFDHLSLHSILSKRDAPWALSYNNHPEILDLYKDYTIHKPEWRYSMKSKNGCKESYEVLITNYS